MMKTPKRTLKWSDSFILKIAILFVCVCDFAFAETNESELVLEHLDVAQIIEVLQRKHSLPICFEFKLPDPEGDGISAQQGLRNLQELSKQRELTSNEKTLLWAAQEIAKHSPDAILEWKLEKVSLEFKTLDLKNVGDVLEKHFPEYVAEISNGTLLFLPKESILSKEIPAFSLERMKISSALSKLSELVNVSGISYIDVQQNIASNEVGPLNCENLPLFIVLTRFVQSLGNDVVWQVDGMKGSPVLSIKKLQ